jgi:hypothetical protein
MMSVTSAVATVMFATATVTTTTPAFNRNNATG